MSPVKLTAQPYRMQAARVFTAPDRNPLALRKAYAWRYLPRTAMTVTPMCITCGVKRRQMAIEPANDLYDLWSYKCPNCETVVKVVKPLVARNVRLNESP